MTSETLFTGKETAPILSGHRLLFPSPELLVGAAYKEAKSFMQLPLDAPDEHVDKDVFEHFYIWAHEMKMEIWRC